MLGPKARSYTNSYYMVDRIRIEFLICHIIHKQFMRHLKKDSSCAFGFVELTDLIKYYLLVIQEIVAE